jgi:geranylgeranyl pyrophosphate synthase
VCDVSGGCLLRQLEERRRQQRVAEITEMIHVASLMHDDVIDTANTRRGLQALNSVFGNKVRRAAAQPHRRFLRLRRRQHFSSCRALRALRQQSAMLGRLAEEWGRREGTEL